MKIFAISDLHLSENCDKPMNVFGGAWENYWQEIKEDWRGKVSDEDIVLIAGDISWAMYLDEAIADLKAIGDLPGNKIIIRGNHDYWWSSYNKVCAALPDRVYALQNNSIVLGKYAFCGTRGWAVPMQNADEQDIKLYEREKIRLKMAVDSLNGKEYDEAFVLIHYPPFNRFFDNSGFTDIVAENAKIKNVVYGHLHGSDVRTKEEVYKGKVVYHLTSCDQMGNKLKLIKED